MKKKIFAIFIAFIIAIPLFTFTVFGATPRWTLFTSATALCLEEDDIYYGDVSTGSNVTRIDMTLVLYEKGIFSSYKEVSRVTKTAYINSPMISGNYSYSSLKNYKVELTATAHTASGQSETITITEEF